MALFLACVICTLLDNPFYNEASTRPLKLFHPGKFLVTLLACPGSWLWLVLVLALHSQGTGSNEISTGITFLAGSLVMPVQHKKISEQGGVHFVLCSVLFKFVVFSV